MNFQKMVFSPNLLKRTFTNTFKVDNKNKPKEIHLMLDLHLVFSCPTKGKRVGILSLRAREREMGLPKSDKKPERGETSKAKNLLNFIPEICIQSMQMQPTPPSKKEERKKRSLTHIIYMAILVLAKGSTSLHLQSSPLLYSPHANMII